MIIDPANFIDPNTEEAERINVFGVCADRTDDSILFMHSEKGKLSAC